MVSYPAEFIEFWSAYPKHVGKREALRAWKQTKNERPPTADVVAKLNRLAVSDQWTRDGGQYVPNPATWLRRGGWDDEVPKRGARGGKPIDPGSREYWGGDDE